MRSKSENNNDNNNNNNNLCIDHTNIKKRKKFKHKKNSHKKEIHTKKKKKGPHTHIDKGGLSGLLRVPSPLPLASFARWAQINPDYNLAKASSDGSFLLPLYLHANSILPPLLTSNIGVP